MEELGAGIKMTNVSKAERFEALGVGIGFLVLQIVVAWLMGMIWRGSRYTTVAVSQAGSLPLRTEEESREKGWWTLPADGSAAELINKVDGALASADGTPSTIPRDFVQALMDVVSTAEIKWRGEDLGTKLNHPHVWDNKIARHCMGKFNGFLDDTQTVMLKYFEVKYKDERLVTGKDRFLTFIPVMMIRALQMHPERSSEIRARMIHVSELVSEDESYNWHYSLVLFSNEEDFQHVLKDTGSPLTHWEEGTVKVFEDPLADDKHSVLVMDYKCIRGENGEIVLEASKWKSEAWKACLGTLDSASV